MVASTEECLSGDGQSIIPRDGTMSDGKMGYSTKSRTAPGRSKYLLSATRDAYPVRIGSVDRSRQPVDEVH